MPKSAKHPISKPPLKPKKKISLSKQVAKTQKVFNEFIRTRDSNLPCISCGSSNTEHAGHFYPAGKYTHLRYNETNVHAQCRKCNFFEHGNLILYRINLEKKIGIDRLLLLDSIAKRGVHKWSIVELEILEDEYKLKARHLGL